MKKTVKRFIRLLCILVAFSLFVITGKNNSKVYSNNLTSVSDTLSTSRLSFVGRLGSGNTTSSSTVFLDTTQGAWESTDSADLFVNDTVGIGNGASIGTDTVTSIPFNSSFNIGAGLTSSQTTTGMFVIATRSATHTVAFTTATAVANGAFRILIPAVGGLSNANAKDGIPDQGGFDFNGTGPTVTCPGNVTGYTFVTGTATASAVTVGSTTYHAFECRYSGSGAVSQAFTVTIGGAHSLINPAPKANHVEGTADSWNYLVQNLDYGNANVYDQTTGAIAVLESVRLTATVAPQITFRIAGVPSGASACGLTTGITTTSTLVPFGTISISSFTIGAQNLSVSTNAASGYVVTEIENDDMGKNGISCATGPCIPASPGDSGTMTNTTTNTWTNSSNYGLGFTIANPNSTGQTMNFAAPNFLDFANARLSQAAHTLFSSTGVASNHNILVCYQIVASATQAAGDYTNNVTYTATGTF